MNTNLINLITRDVDQQKGILDKKTPQQDHWESKTVKTRQLGLVYLSIVADGGGNNSPEVAAKLAVDTIFTEFEQANEKSLNEILQGSLFAANALVYQQNHGNDYVGVTVVAIKNNRLHMGQVGRLTRASLLSSESLVEYPLGSVRCLGDSLDPLDIHIEEAALKKGDRIVICSDGLFDLPEKESYDNKVKGEIQAACNNDNIHGSARYLTSIAKGLDSDDDITVVVLGLGRRSAKPFVNILAVSAIAVVLLLIIAVGYTLQPKQPSRPQNLGLAILVSGNAASVDPQTKTQTNIQQLTTINPGISLVVLNGNTVNLKLERRADTSNSNTTNITGIDIYLSEQTEAILTTLDLAPTVGNSPADPGFINLTEITLMKGQILVRSDGSRKYAILIPAQQNEKNAQIILSSGGKGILGVSEEGTSVVAYCLQGACQYTPPGEVLINLSTPGKTNIDMTSPSNPTSNESITDEDWKMWNTICSGSQPGSCDLSK